MNHKKLSNAPFTPFEIHQVKLPVKSRDSPFSILKTPTAIFVKTRSSTAKTKKLTFANGPIDLQTLRNGSQESDVSFDSGVETGTDQKSSSNGDISFDGIIEVAISPVKTMQVSPETWKAFLEYKKYSDYPNETEKTDYTYSRLSKFRHKEIIPGFLIRPNLSRSSISSRRTSLSYPSSQTSFNESYQSGSYDFKVYNQPKTEVIYDYNIPSQTNKFVRSKYYLRSSDFGSKDTAEDDSKSNYFEKEYHNQLFPEEEKFIKKTAYMTTESHEPSVPYYAKVRSLNLDDADIDEVDVNADQHEHHRYGIRDASKGEVWSGRNDEASTAKNFFTAVFLYVTAFGTLTRDIFSKYVLKRENDWTGSPYQNFGWQKDRSKQLDESWVSWGGKKDYMTTGYYSGRYYGRPRNWYQKIYYYIYDKCSQMKNFLSGDRVGYSSYRYDDSSSKRKFWWFFIPLLLLAGSFLGYIDFFSNPKAILNTLYNWLLFLPSFTHYTFMTFIPWLITEFIPFLVLTWVPNFITVTIPYFVTITVPYYFWVVVHFFGGLTVSSVWNAIIGSFNFALNFVVTAGTALFGLLFDLISAGCLISFKYLMLFYTNFCLWLYNAEQEHGFISNQYRQLDCRTNGLLTSVENAIKPISESGYIAYKRISASAFCYMNDSWERLKLPFVQISERLSESSLGFLFKIWHGLQGALLFSRNFFSNFCWFILGFATDVVTAIGNLVYLIFRNAVDGIILFANPLLKALQNFWHLFISSLQNFRSYLYLLFFAPGNEVKYKIPDVPETCFKQEKRVDMLKSELENIKSLSGDFTTIKRKIDELELELLKEKELRKNQNELYDRQLDENHKTFQKYQTTVNHALFSAKRPPHFSTSSVQYLLDNHSDSLKQWITQNFLLKSDSRGLDEEKLTLLLAKFTNKSGEELLALKEEFAHFVEKHKTDLESLRNNYNLLPKGGDISLAYVNKIVDEAIKRYDADKTGKVDYALETAGGQVVSIRCTETYIERPKSYVLLGWSVWSETSSPRDAINPGVAPGQCWAFVGSQGFLVLQLSHTIRVTGFTMEHISKSLVPRGHIESAPKDFSMWGLKHEHDVEPHFFGEYKYQDNDETLQYFPVSFPSSERYNMVELKITSNHGNPNCTCLYRIRVHGDLRPSSL